MVASQYKEKRQEFINTAKKWTQDFANPDKINKEKIQKLTDMGFTEEQAVAALEKTGWDEDQAIQALIS